MKTRLRKIISVLLILTLLLGITMPAMATHHSFSDVRDGQWYSEAVQFVYERNIMGGVGNNQFNPQGNLTRAQATAVLFRTHNERTANADDSCVHPFADVPNDWSAPYIAWAYQNNIVTGTSPATFNPDGNVTRQEFATMVYRYVMNMTNLCDGEVSSEQWWRFADRWRIVEWAYSALRWMNNRGIVTGSTVTTINPTGTATRAEAAMMMMRFVELPMPPLVCPGCGDERIPWVPSSSGHLFQNNAVIIVLTRCVSQRDNRDWTLDDFGDTPGALYLEDLTRLSDGEWELIQDGRWQETFRNWPQFRRSMLMRFDQNCRENVIDMIHQLQQHEFIRWVGPAYIGPGPGI